MSGRSVRTTRLSGQFRVWKCLNRSEGTGNSGQKVKTVLFLTLQGLVDMFGAVSRMWLRENTLLSLILTLGGYLMFENTKYLLLLLPSPFGSFYVKKNSFWFVFTHVETSVREDLRKYSRVREMLMNSVSLLKFLAAEVSQKYSRVDEIKANPKRRCGDLYSGAEKSFRNNDKSGEFTGVSCMCCGPKQKKSFRNIPK